MIARRKALHMAAAVALTAYIFCTVLIRTFGDKAWSVSLPKLDLSRNYMADSVFEHIQNNTLGFEHIYAISMKERTDKRDFLTLAASVSGFKVEWLDGVRPDELHPKAMPDEAPYGMDWDLLWIGGCASGPNANETSFYAIPMDPTVPRVHHRATWGGPTKKWKEQYPELAEDSTRFIYRADMGCCMFRYAVTTKGARKIVSALSVDHLNKPVDNALSELCAGANGRHKIECWAPFPNLIGTYRKAGSASRDSDIESNNAAEFHEELAWNMVYSTRRNIHQLVSGGETVYSQWKDEEVPWSRKAIKHREFAYPSGYLVK
ncbi:LPS glycosyltransferase, putative [Penicillium digitatum PHI26]|uniref:LPS glycosyltransferase, putative n=1 Tax=Penicillium digitatum (strain PHI26 / CECT 20796) TaxID=1170229 RepID=K9FV16_PEND2|nr:LPS glycosyltransferase, putative [Penicillium digitatum PHI26]